MSLDTGIHTVVILTCASVGTVLYRRLGERFRPSTFSVMPSVIQLLITIAINRGKAHLFVSRFGVEAVQMYISNEGTYCS